MEVAEDLRPRYVVDVCGRAPERVGQAVNNDKSHLGEEKEYALGNCRAARET